MSVFELLAVALISAVDGFFTGAAYGLKRVRFRPMILLGIAFWMLPFSVLAMLCSQFLGALIVPDIAKHIGGALLVLAGGFGLWETLRQKGGTCSPAPQCLSMQKAVLMGCALAVDGSIAVFSAGLLGASPFLTPLLFSAVHMVLLTAGNRLGSLGKQSRVSFDLLPSVVLMLMGALKLFG